MFRRTPNNSRPDTPFVDKAVEAYGDRIAAQRAGAAILESDNVLVFKPREESATGTVVPSEIGGLVTGKLIEVDFRRHRQVVPIIN